MGVSRDTLSRLEKGDATIALGTYLRALRVLGLDGDLDVIARDDVLGRKLQDLELIGNKSRDQGQASGKNSTSQPSTDVKSPPRSK
jgi:hypothetical protein